jgi:hypothetical protein
VGRFGTHDHVLIRPVINKEEEHLELVENILYSKFYYPENSTDDQRSGEILWEHAINAKFKEMGLTSQLLHNHRSLFALTVLAICSAWKVPSEEVIKYSMLSITKWAPKMPAYKSKFAGDIVEVVLVIINPRATTRKQIAKKYEREIKEWIGVKDDPNFNVEDFYNENETT